MGYPKLGKHLIIIFIFIIVIIFVITAFQDQLFTKNDAKKLIEEQNFKLIENFKILENKSTSSFGDYYHTFTLEISNFDKINAIKAIKSSSNFKNIGEHILVLPFEIKDRYNGPKLIQNYETENAYIREYFEPNGQGYAPTYRSISIKKSNNQLTFEDNDF